MTAKLTGIALRDAMAEDYAANWRRLGLGVDFQALQALATSDLQLVEAAERNAGYQFAPSESEPAPPRTTASDLIAEQGMQLVGEHRTKFRSRVLDAPPAEVGERFQAAIARIARIMSPRGDLRTAYVRGGFDAAVREMEAPALAREVLELFVHYSALRNRSSRWNPFAGMTPKDSARALIRALEDVCDRSTGLFGQWFIPK